MTARLSAAEAEAATAADDANPTMGAAQLRRLLEERRAPLFRRVSEVPAVSGENDGGLGLSLGCAHAEVLDGLVQALFPSAVEGALTELGRAKPSSPAQPSIPAECDLALAGVGGYGRGAVALGSDLDVRLLTEDLELAEAVASKLLYPLWDSGLSVGHQVVGADELLEAARDDLPTATSLLDWRHVAGDPMLSENLRRRAATGLFAPSALGTFLDRLETEVEQRHRRFGGSVYLLQPNVKNGRGGLRDLDVARWAAAARWGVRDVDDLLRYGVIVARHLRAVTAAREHLWQIRNVLHDLAGRRSDRLVFDAQEVVAARLGYEGTVAEATERLMSDYYRAARTIARFRDMIMAKAQPTLRRRRPAHEALEEGIHLFDGEVALDGAALLMDDPAIALRVVSAAVERGVPIRASTRSAIIALCGDKDWALALRSSSGAARQLVALVSDCRETNLKTGSTMRELHDLGLLLAMIPEFAPVVGRVHHDTYHVYTVDVHSVAAVDRLVEIVRGEVALEDSEDEGGRWVGSLACRLGSEMTRPAVLFFATLLHDVGKAIGRRNHSERGAEMAEAILTRLDFDSAARAEVSRLIRHHLQMYLTATRRDVDDPATLEHMAQLVGGPEGLRDLYLLTVADLSTTSPTSLTSWKARMLDELYIATQRHLRGEHVVQAAIEERRAELLAKIVDEDERRFCERFIDGMPSRYCFATPPEKVRAHAAQAHRHLASGAAATVELTPVRDEDAEKRSSAQGAARVREVAELCVVAQDRPGLLAAITAALAGCRLQVHAAQINSCAVGAGEQIDAASNALAVDVFWVRHAADGAKGTERALERLRRDLARVMSGALNARELLPSATPSRAIRGKEPKVDNKVIVDNRAASGHTVVEVITRDRPGLLFALADAIYRMGLSIAVAKIATEGTRVVDVFYLGERDGKKVSVAQRGEELKTTLMNLIEQMDNG